MEMDDLYRKLSKLGLPFFETEVDVNETIAQVVMSKSNRLWEGFPVLLANANKTGFFSYKKIKELLKNKKELYNFVDLLFLSFAVYKYLHLQFYWERELKVKIISRGKNKTKMFLYYLKSNEDIKIAQIRLNPQRIINFFHYYFKGEEFDTERTNIKSKELSLEYALSHIFTPKQKDIFLKKIKGEKLTKSQRERFYRVVKKKVMAILNPELQRLAKQLIVL